MCSKQANYPFCISMMFDDFSLLTLQINFNFFHNWIVQQFFYISYLCPCLIRVFARFWFSHFSCIYFFQIATKRILNKVAMTTRPEIHYWTFSFDLGYIQRCIGSSILYFSIDYFILSSDYLSHLRRSILLCHFSNMPFPALLLLYALCFSTLCTWLQWNLESILLSARKDRGKSL